MRRKALGRDLGLSVRMAFVGALVVALYAGLFGLSLLVVAIDPGDLRSWLAPVLVGGGIVAHYVGADALVLRAARARVVEPDEAPALHGMVDRLCALADMPKPRVAVSPSPVPNAFATGVTPARSTVVVTTGLWERLEPLEVEAVLAHELAHVANRDAIVITAASLFPTLGAYLGRWRFGTHDYTRRKRDRREYVFWPVLMLLAGELYVFGALLTFAISRYREYAADRGAVLITGAPEQLMSALQKLTGEIAQIPKQDLRALTGLNAFFIVPAVHPRRFELSMDHPPLRKRLARLAGIARELGSPDDPHALAGFRVGREPWA